MELWHKALIWSGMMAAGDFLSVLGTEGTLAYATGLGLMTFAMFLAPAYVLVRFTNDMPKWDRNIQLREMNGRLNTIEEKLGGNN